MDYSRKKKQREEEGWGAVWGYIFVKKDLEFLGFPLYPLEIPEPEKTSSYSHTGNSTKLCDTPSCGNPKVKTKTHGNCTQVFLEYPCKFHFFLNEIYAGICSYMLTALINNISK